MIKLLATEAAFRYSNKIEEAELCKGVNRCFKHIKNCKIFILKNA